MGITYIDGEVVGPTGHQRVRFLVDSGASYTVLPRAVWAPLGVETRRHIRMRLADGRELRRPLGNCVVRLPQGETPTWVILGEDADLPLLGSVTLEELGLVLDPLQRTLHPMQVLVPTIEAASESPDA